MDVRNKINKKDKSEKRIFHASAERPPSGEIFTKLGAFGDVASIINRAKFQVDRCIDLNFTESKFTCSHMKDKSPLILHALRAYM